MAEPFGELLDLELDAVIDVPDSGSWLLTDASVDDDGDVFDDHELAVRWWIRAQVWEPSLRLHETRDDFPRLAALSEGVCGPMRTESSPRLGWPHAKAHRRKSHLGATRACRP